MKRRIAIQTFRLTNNYGGILQAFALQHFLEKKGNHVIHLNREFTPASLIARLKISAFKIAKRSLYQTTQAVDRIYKKFIEQHINVSESLKTTEEWRSFIKKNKFDLVLVGSDQVWRLSYINTLYPEFFLDFDIAGTKKASYAASFGVSNLSDYPIQELTGLLKQFSGISVREDSGVTLIKDNFQMEAHHHIDPTLLLTAEEYITHFKLNDKDIKDEIFCYVLDKNAEKQQIISKVQTAVKGSVNFVYGSSVTASNYQDKDLLNKPTIEQWLQSFLSASYVVTDSFHGMVFSIIFNKPFLVIANEERGVDRFKSLLSKLGLSNRLVYMNADWDTAVIDQAIDFAAVDAVIKQEREIAVHYLNTL